MLCARRVGTEGREKQEAAQRNHVMSIECRAFLEKPLRASSSTQPRLCPRPQLRPAICRWALLEWQILEPGKRGFCDFFLGFFLRTVLLCIISPPLPVPWPPECGPHGGARIVSEEDGGVLGSECADLGLDGGLGLHDQGLLLFKDSSSIKMP